MSALKFSCPLCSFQTKRKSHLDKHKKMHEGMTMTKKIFWLGLKSLKSVKSAIMLHLEK